MTLVTRLGRFVWLATVRQADRLAGWIPKTAERSRRRPSLAEAPAPARHSNLAHSMLPVGSTAAACLCLWPGPRQPQPPASSLSLAAMQAVGATVRADGSIASNREITDLQWSQFESSEAAGLGGCWPKKWYLYWVCSAVLCVIFLVLCWVHLPGIHYWSPAVVLGPNVLWNVIVNQGECHAIVRPKNSNRATQPDVVSSNQLLADFSRRPSAWHLL